MKTEKLSILERIELWFRFEGRYYHRDFINGIKNLIRWFPTIWKDRDWDDHFIWQIMIQKLKFQSEYLSEYGNHVDSDRDSQKIMLCVSLMERIKTEYYMLEYQDYHELEVNFVPTTLTNGQKGYEYKTKTLSEDFNSFFKKYPKVYKKTVEKLKKERDNFGDHTIAFYMSQENHKRARKILFNLLENNMEKWWN